MSTRLKRPSVWRPLGLTLVLVGFHAYLGFSAIGGQFGIENHKAMLADIDLLNAQSSALNAEIEAYRHRVGLFNPTRLDPDILSERARALLSMAEPDEVIIMVNPDNGLPVFSSSMQLAEDQLSTILRDVQD
jgi:cell division protein FtsB